MKKYMNMPDVKVVRFDNKDVIATSGRIGINNEGEAIGTAGDIGVQERRSIWD